MKNYDVVIVGAGVLGAAISFEMQKKGHKTCMVDYLKVPGAGSTAFSCGIVRSHYSQFQGVALSNESAQYWLKWEDYLESKDPSGIEPYHNCGMLYFRSPNVPITEQVLEMERKVGVNFSLYSPEDIKENFPYLNLQSHSPVKRIDDPEFFNDDDYGMITGAIFEHDSGYVADPGQATRNLFHAATEKGAESVLGQRVVNVNKDGERVTGVTLENGAVLNAPVVINAAGPHSYIINDMAGADIPLTLKPILHEVHVVPKPDDVDIRRMPVIGDLDSGIYFRPELPDRILLGSTDPECDQGRENVIDPDNFDAELTDECFNNQVLRLQKRLPSIAADGDPRSNKIPFNIAGHASPYDVTTDDWYPIFDKTEVPGYYVAVGTSGGWFKGAPMIGKMMTQLVEAVEGGHDHDNAPLDIDLSLTGQTLSLENFSRLRTPLATTMGVTG